MDFLSSMNRLLWGGPLLILLLGTHLFFTFYLKFPQKHIFKAIKMSIRGENGGKKEGDLQTKTVNDTNTPFDKVDIVPSDNSCRVSDSVSLLSDTRVAEKSGVSPFAALSTTLAATLGTGNIIGVSTAVALGGPGAIFWCWLTGIFGMATSYGECFLGVLFRVKNPSNQYVGGPMYMLRDGLSSKFLANFYAFSTVIAAFGVGCTTQANSLVQTTTLTFGLSPHLVGFLVALFTGLVIMGGIENISKFCMKIVPILGLFYIGACLFLLCKHIRFLPISISTILRSAFGLDSGENMVKTINGGVGAGIISTFVRNSTLRSSLGNSLSLSARYGISRGLYTNEAGIGTGAIAASSSDTGSPSLQAYISMTAVFWDTVVMCLLSGLVIVTNSLAHPSSTLNVGDANLVSAAFQDIPRIGPTFLALSLAAFALTTLIGWSYLGEKAVEFLWKSKGIYVYKLIYIVMIYVGAVIPMKLVWESTDLVNAIMVVPNVLALFALRKRIKT